MLKVLVRPITLLAYRTCPQTRIRTRTVHRREPVCRLSLIAARRKTRPDDPRTVTAEDPLTGATFKAFFADFPATNPSHFMFFGPRTAVPCRRGLPTELPRTAARP